MNIYYSEIHRRADYGSWKQSLDAGEVTFEQWAIHWLNTAREWEAQCKADGLTNTAKYIRDIITFHEKYG